MKKATERFLCVDSFVHYWKENKIYESFTDSLGRRFVKDEEGDRFTIEDGKIDTSCAEFVKVEFDIGDVVEVDDHPANGIVVAIAKTPDDDIVYLVKSEDKHGHTGRRCGHTLVKGDYLTTNQGYWYRSFMLKLVPKPRMVFSVVKCAERNGHGVSLEKFIKDCGRWVIDCEGKTIAEIKSDSTTSLYGICDDWLVDEKDLVDPQVRIQEEAVEAERERKSKLLFSAVKMYESGDLYDSYRTFEGWYLGRKKTNSWVTQIDGKSLTWISENTLYSVDEDWVVSIDEYISPETYMTPDLLKKYTDMVQEGKKLALVMRDGSLYTLGADGTVYLKGDTRYDLCDKLDKSLNWKGVFLYSMDVIFVVEYNEGDDLNHIRLFPDKHNIIWNRDLTPSEISEFAFEMKQIVDAYVTDKVQAREEISREIDEARAELSQLKMSI